ncbi:MAG: HD-GYP domain-containing protein [Lachnospiraceae bacterium]|nr:HD-GYP domain-containing protein [Lachnospiraceae bacterium]
MKKKVNIPLYIFLLLLYIGTTGLTSWAANSGAQLTLGGRSVPMQSLTGVFSSMTNIMVFLMVVFFDRLGYITALSLLLTQFPLMFVGIVIAGNVQSIPGVFTNLLTIVAIILIQQRNKRIKEYQSHEIDQLKGRQKLSQRLFEQTAAALVNSIDAKDEYSHGHSQRVALYAEKIARELKMSEDECYKVYYAGLLHDVGKIGIADNIINKNGKLTQDEYDIIKQHTVMGNQILQSISEYPFLSVGAHYHHERYDGTGYPQGLMGEEIPEIARIISVADSYDAMTSTRSYREAIPQQLVREEIVKGSGTQFDPKIARVMQHLIDNDMNYRLREKSTGKRSSKNELHCDAYRSDNLDGFVVMPCSLRMQFNYAAEGEGDQGPVFLLYDSMDGFLHETEKAARELNYFEFGEIHVDGTVSGEGIRALKTTKTVKEGSRESERNDGTYVVELVKRRDHMRVRIDDGAVITEHIIALPDSSRYVYVALTGEHCDITELNTDRSETPIAEDEIPRIAEEVCYIDGPEGDLPSIQIDGYRTASTRGVEVADGMRFSFHVRSLPTARLIWHCPYIVLYYSRNGEVNGEDYREYALVRLDGEFWEGGVKVENKLVISKNDSFAGWEYWKESFREGLECQVSFTRKGNSIIVNTENLGVFVSNHTEILDGTDEIYAALSGDQCVLTDIRIQKV